MILHGEVTLRRLVRASAPFLIGVTLWNLFVVPADEVLQLTLVGEPTAPVATLGVAVAFYLGFKNTSAFGRWWEARNIWGEIVNGSRDWANAVTHLVDPPAAPGDDALRRTLIERHIAWLNLLAFQLRTQTPLSRKRRRWMFGHPPRRGDAALHQTSDSWQAYLPPEARAELDGTANKAAHLNFRQGETLRELGEAGRLDPIRHVALMDRLQALITAQGKCERIKNTPFPRQIADLGEIFTWIFILLLPLMFNEAFEMPALWDSPLATFLTHALLVVPTSVLVCWVFFLTERVSDSMEDPFDGEATDVPISALCRTIEIDMRQTTGIGHPPAPPAPVGGVLN